MRPELISLLEYRICIPLIHCQFRVTEPWRLLVKHAHKFPFLLEAAAVHIVYLVEFLDVNCIVPFHNSYHAFRRTAT